MKFLYVLMGLSLVAACKPTDTIVAGKGRFEKFIFVADPITSDCASLISAFNKNRKAVMADDVRFSEYMECVYQGKALAVRYDKKTKTKSYEVIEPAALEASLDLSQYIKHFGGAHDAIVYMKDPGAGASVEDLCLSGEDCGVESEIVAGVIPLVANVVPDQVVPIHINTGKLGGCGVWAAGIANRELGFAWDKAKIGDACPTKNGEKDGRYMCYRQEEYKDLTKALGTTLGATPLTFTAQYYASKGYCSDYRVFGGTDEEYDEVSKALAAGCSIQLSFGKTINSILDPKSSSFLTDPCLHIENVVGVCLDPKTNCMQNAQATCKQGRTQENVDPFWWNGDPLPSKAFITNSWGGFGCISGGSLTNFHHSRTPAFSKSAQEQCWPPDSTDIFIDFICPCTAIWPTEPDLKEFILDLDSDNP